MKPKQIISDKERQKKGEKCAVRTEVMIIFSSFLFGVDIIVPNAQLERKEVRQAGRQAGNAREILPENKGTEKTLKRTIEEKPLFKRLIARLGVENNEWIYGARRGSSTSKC